jgi:hypothetical protein
VKGDFVSNYAHTSSVNLLPTENWGVGSPFKREGGRFSSSFSHDGLVHKPTFLFRKILQLMRVCPEDALFSFN